MDLCPQPPTISFAPHHMPTTYLRTICSKSGTAPYIYTHTHTIHGHVLAKAKPPRVKDSNEQPLFPTQIPHVGKEGCTFVVWSYGTYYFRLTRKQDASRKQWNILLTITINSIYLHQGPRKLSSTLPGTPSNSNSQNHEVFKLNREERQEWEKT